MGAWYGSKATTGLSQAIVGLMRPHDTYIETHLGGGAIMKRKPPALRSIGIDLNARSIGTLCCDYEVELVHGCCHRFPADYPFEGSELVYSDPPYLMSTRKSQRRYRYRYSDADHEALPHWHACAGRNFTDRRRIKRKAASRARRYRAMPPGERLAVLAAVMAVEAE